MPGAVEFANYVNSHGGTMFYVSNRDQKDYAATVDNLNKLGFSGVSDKTVRLSTGNSNKQARFDAIKNAGYNVVLYIGDNLNDFGGATGIRATRSASSLSRSTISVLAPSSLCCPIHCTATGRAAWLKTTIS